MLNLTFKVRLIIFLFLNILFLNSEVSSQNEDIAVNAYLNKLSNPNAYINGREYKPYFFAKQENPYFNQEKGVGNIYIDGFTYTEKKLIYDINLDQLIVIPDLFQFSNTYIQLNKTRVDSFSISFNNKSYTLTNLKFESQNDLLSDGYYQIIYQSDKASILLKHFMIVGKKDGYMTYRQSIKKFFLINNKYFEVTTKKDLYNIVREQKVEVKKILKTFRTRYKKLNNNQLIVLIKYFEKP